jgi:hypothetical protein
MFNQDYSENGKIWQPGSITRQNLQMQVRFCQSPSRQQAAPEVFSKLLNYRCGAMGQILNAVF